MLYWVHKMLRENYNVEKKTVAMQLNKMCLKTLCTLNKCCVLTPKHTMGH